MGFEKDRFIPLEIEKGKVELPKLFTFPFFYEVNPMCELAAIHLQKYLLTQEDWKHNFGLDPEDTTLVIGKMFGVLIVQNTEGEIGYLASYSGKLADSNDHPFFVPPVYDMLHKNGFYREGEQYLNQLNARIVEIESDSNFISLKAEYESRKQVLENELQEKREELKKGKKLRDLQRKEAALTSTPEELELLKAVLKDESLKQQYFFKLFVKEMEEELFAFQSKLSPFEDELSQLKTGRKAKSNELQNRLFDNYQFLNALNETKSLNSIFKDELQIVPPAGAGECAAPKLLHYAYVNQLKPIAMAEFWWGQSPKAELRKHKEFYPACRSKCEPILGHMLKGLDVEPNPMLENCAEGKIFDIVFEDEYLLLVNKPAEFLSVPGRNIQDSVQYRIQQIYTEAILVHRLDQSTSGLILIAKNKEIHQHLQSQFIKRTVQKRYLALLDGEVKETEGVIDLPLRVDLDNRPHQLVCKEHGKHAQTKFEVLELKEGRTRIHFYPITGRTHQLRVHAAHVDGLNASIVGDDLYGRKSNRLHLQAQYLEFTHPVSKERLKFELESDF